MPLLRPPLRQVFGLRKSTQFRVGPRNNYPHEGVVGVETASARLKSPTRRA